MGSFCGIEKTPGWNWKFLRTVSFLLSNKIFHFSINDPWKTKERILYVSSFLKGESFQFAKEIHSLCEKRWNLSSFSIWKGLWFFQYFVWSHWCTDCVWYIIKSCMSVESKSFQRCASFRSLFNFSQFVFAGDFEAKVAGNPKWKCSLCKIFIQSGFCNKPSCDFAHGNEELRVETPENPRIIRSNYKRVMCNNWASNGHCFHEDTCSFAHGEEELQKFSCSKDVASALKLFRGGPAGMRKRPTTAMSQTGMGGGHMGQPRFTSMNATAADQKLFAEFLEFKKFKEQTEGIKYMPGIGMQQTDARPAVTQFFNSFQAGNSMKRPVMPTVPLDPMVSRGSINVKSVPVGAGYLEGANSAGGLGRRINPRNGNRTTVTEMGNAMFNGVRNDAFVAAGVRRQEMEHAFAY